MVRSEVRHLRLLERAGDQDLPRLIQVGDARAGDIIEIPDRPIYEVDPISHTCRDRLQRFRVGAHGSIVPVH
jgi:hypothetical protein